MTAKVFDVLIYSAATIVILAIMSSATIAEKKNKEQVDDEKLIEVKEPLIIEESAGVPASDVVFAVKSQGGSCKPSDGSCVSAGKGGLAKVKPKKQLRRRRGAVVRWIRKVLEGKR